MKMKEKQPKLYYFMNNGHHCFIWRIEKDAYWVYDLCTTRYTDERWVKLEEAIKYCKRYWKIQEFNTYREVLAYMTWLESWYDFMDLYWDKNLIERESLQNDKVKEIHSNLWI